MNNNEEKDFEELANEMRSQIAILKEKLDKEHIVNEKLLRKSMSSGLTTINRTRLITLFCAAFCLVLYPIMGLVGDMSWGVVICTEILMIVCVIATEVMHAATNRINLATANLREVATTLAKLKKDYNWWLLYATPVIIVPWFIYFMYDYSRVHEMSTLATVVATVFFAICGGVGLAIGYHYHKKLVDACDEIIKQIEEQ